jgi:hypothetical protein
MMVNITRVFFLLFVALSAIPLRASEPVSHLAQWLLFEVIEDGAVSNKRVALDIYASQDATGKTWAEAKVAVITIDHTQKRVALDPYYCSTDQATIKSLRIDKDVVSFEMMPFPLAPDRPIRVIAKREGKSSAYRVSAIGLWSNLFTKDPMKVEWKQVSTIELPYRTITR